MEPEIIRMYSSSPPPLDNGAEEEEDDEFGDFGGFSGAGGSTSVGFDFGLDYSNSKEEHESPYNADYSNSVDGIIAFTPARYINDSDSITELQNSIKGLPDSASKEKCECRRLGASFNELNSAEVNRTERSEAPHSEIIRTDRKAARQDQQIDSYYGKRLLCPEVLTNGFAALDAANPPGVEDLDSISDSKTLKTTSTHSIDLSLDSVPSTVEDFADFAKFSNKQAAQVEETGNKICKNSSEREALGVHESNIINSAGQGESMKEVASDGSCEHEGETCTESELVCISTTNVVIREDVKGEEDCRTLECADAFSSMQTNVNSVGTTESIEGRGEGDAGNSKERDFSQTSDTASLLNLDVSNVQDLGCLPAEEHVPISEIVKNGESELGQASLSDLNEDDFGDFGTVSNGSPAFADGVQVSVSQEDLQTPLEKQINKPSNECGPFLGRSDSQQIAMVAPLETSDISRSGLEECQSAGPGSGIEMPLAEMENENDREFGDFDSVTKRCLDADDFSDFSSAGCSQATEWNAFECDQKESCSWAAFGDEQIVGSPHEQDVWPAHRTDATASSEDSVLHKTDSISITTFHGSGSRQLHELPTSAQTMLLSRLERIFEACFPTVPVCEIEEEIVPLNLLLEAGSTPGRPAEPLSERELLDVWAELQDIHDAYGLRYQWGGSHSNKKLLCSLGIDTRNILFTGNKKQPFIVPMYAAGLGMLEPTKEPLKPISAAEKIASIGQTLPVSPEMNICTSDQFQESLPPVQFDWSTSGLTNPLDGVDPELYELTTSKLEATNVTNKVTDAFAKLMSTVEKASTSARKPKKEERLSEEAAQVIASLPDLTFMHAKVLMFPATLTPSASCQDQVD
ncbi:aftiphilin isoform X2 [Eublepharis macularius]|uniref:Aftiphilin isoform X2 n=1 Tax=Eublepharis macularius TaxID=481883 RepID=A0AA97KWN8_EUBMA|nr:aftiphilin isoform X2 [Eublepharis macularius]